LIRVCAVDEIIPEIIKSGNWSRYSDGEFELYMVIFADGVGPTVNVQVTVLTPLKRLVFEHGYCTPWVVRTLACKL